MLESNVDIGVLLSLLQENMPGVWSMIDDIDEPGPGLAGPGLAGRGLAGPGPGPGEGWRVHRPARGCRALVRYRRHDHGAV